MKKIILTIKENWKDPVWSKVIAAIIISTAGVIFTTLYSLFTSLVSSISFKDAFNNIWSVLNKSTEIKIWLFITLTALYLILIFPHFVFFIKNIIKKVNNPDTEKNKKKKLPKAIDDSTSFFYQRMASAFPGIREVTWFENPKEAITRLQILLEEPLVFESNHREFEVDPIWWFRGIRSSYIEKFEKLSSKKGLINNIGQFKIKRIAAYHGDAYYKDFVYVEAEGEKQTGLYDLKKEEIKKHIETFGYSWEEYGIIQNKIGWKTLIRREDYEDGATVIRGKVRNAMDAKLRVRYLSNYNFIIAAKGSPYNSQKFQSCSRDYLDRILKQDIKPNNFFDFLKNFNKYER